MFDEDEEEEEEGAGNVLIFSDALVCAGRPR